MKKAKVLSFMLVFIGIITLFACTTLEASEDVYITIDINPSIELVINPREKVIIANGLNEDGDLLLAGLELIGLDLSEAIDLLIEEAIYLGFIDYEDDEIDISVDTMARSEIIRARIHERVKANIDQAFERRAMVGRAIDKAFVEAIREEAESYGVAPGFLRLVYSVLAQNDVYTLEELLEMEQDALIELLKEAQREQTVIIHHLREAFIEARQDIYDAYRPLIHALVLQLEDEDADVEAIMAEIEALRLQMREEIEALREDFVAQAQLLAEQLRLAHEQRREAHREAVESFLEEAQARRDAIKDRIEEYQNRERGR